MSVDEPKTKKNKDIMETPADTAKLYGENSALKTHRENLRRRVLDLLKAPDPVCGIYAMYGAHERSPQCIPGE